MIFLRCEAWLYQLYCFRLSHTCPPAKNVCSRDLELNKDTPLFATSDGPLLLIKAGAIDSLNSCMMNVRWRFYHFWNQIPQEKQQELISRGRCWLCQVQATEPLRLRRDKSFRHAHLSDPGSFLGYISHSRFSLK